jgi:hypothetical protein
MLVTPFGGELFVWSQERRLNLVQPFQFLPRALPVDVRKSSAFPTGVKVISRGYAAVNAG